MINALGSSVSRDPGMTIRRQIWAQSVFATRYVDQPAVPERLVHHTVIPAVKSIKHENFWLLHKLQGGYSLGRYP